MKIARTPTRLILTALLLVLAMLCASAAASAATIKVKTERDDLLTGGNCSLRQAIQAANTDSAYGGCTAGSGADTIQLKAGVRYIRELDGPNAEDSNASGDFDIASPITITVKGNGKAEINGGGLDRVLQVLPGAKLTASYLTLRDGNVANNQPSSYTGGGAILAQGDLDLTHSNVTQNRAQASTGCDCGGGVMAVAPAAVVLDHDKITENNVENIGGAIAWLGGKLQVNHTTMASNKADYSGGAMYLGSSSGTGNSATVRNSTLSNNSSLTANGNSGGGAMFVSDFTQARLRATNVTITGNSSSSAGGGIWQYNGALKVDASTIARNTADASGTGISGGGGVAGSVIVTNSIVASNKDLNATTPTPDCYGNPSVADSLVGKDTGCTGAPTNRVAKHPGLAQLASNGGPTQTLALLKSSPAVNHGSKSEPNTDQRGRKRDSRPDVGAYELIPRKHHH